MSISRRRQDEKWQLGFTLIELLVGITLTVLLVLGTSPLLLAVQGAGVKEADRTIVMLQGRVAAFRLERDLRSASAGGSEFTTDGAVLEATPRQVVFLSRVPHTESLCIVEWEIVGTSLMRRWGPCPDMRPGHFSHSLYVDNKTMLEGLAEDAHFVYWTGGQRLEESVSSDNLVFIERVSLQGSGRDSEGKWPWAVSAAGWIGR